jgi:hypothetical protein
MTPDILKLEAEITAAQEAISEQTRLAVSEARTQATLLKRGKEIAEKKEVLKLLQLQLRQAKKDHAAKQAEQDQAERLGRRRQIAEISEGVSDDVKKLAAAIRKAAPHYKSINDRVWQIMQLGQNAADFDLGLFKSAHPTSKAYEIFVHLAAREFGLGPADHFSHWPRSHQIEESIQKALATFANLADWPKEDEPEVEEFEEVKEEELENAL